ncbi:MAG: hypothetical protein JF597_45725 [Streptomyces sp.]|uniref:hypothetical protein n=1 Tax=Streptomyces sp. TaxID=1931 RepID=UPI0025FEBFD0|nr:hypothetical protein [Streptomyces sp.]MBW8800614.1 hypothetical protein [Streptomyces sp.]
MERSYQVRPEQAMTDPAARAAMTRDDHERAFTTFATSLMTDFGRCLAYEDADPPSDGVVYRQAATRPCSASRRRSRTETAPNDMSDDLRHGHRPTTSASNSPDPHTRPVTSNFMMHTTQCG